MYKKIAVILITLVIITTAIIFYLQSKPPVIYTVNDTVKAIPVNAAFVIETKNFNSLKQKLDTNAVWKILLGTEFFREINTVYSIIDSASLSEIKKILSGNSVYISAHPAGVKNFDFLFTITLPSGTGFSIVDESIKGICGNAEAKVRPYDDATINTILLKKESFSFSVYKNILVISKNDLLVEDALRQLNAQNNLLMDAGFNKIIHASGTTADFHAYINYRQMPICLRRYFNEGSMTMINTLPELCTWSEFDAMIKTNGLALNGIACINDSTASFINVFADQHPHEFQFQQVLPENTAFFTYWGISDIKKFQLHYKTYLDSKRKLAIHDYIVKGLKTNYSIDVEQFLQSSFRNELIYVITKTNTKQFYSDNSLALMRVKDAEDAAKILNTWCDSVDQTQKTKPDTSNYRGYSIRELHIPSLLQTMFGDLFKYIDHTNYTFVDDYLVIANTIPNLKGLINDYENGRTLKNSNRYTAFSANLSDESNIYVYASTIQGIGLFKESISDEQAKVLNKNIPLFNQFYACGIQYSRGEKFIYNNLYIDRNTQSDDELKTVWNAELDTCPYTEPFIVVNHKTNKKEIFVQDKHNIVYLISTDGKILWRLKLPEKILGSIQQVDSKKNGKLQLLFNTESYIYLLDRNGENVEHFPVDLRSPATSPIVVVDYEHKKDYRIIVSCANKKTYCYNAKAEVVKQWNIFKTDNVVRLPAQFISSEGKDNLIFVDEGGMIYVVDRKGEMRFAVKESFQFQPAGFTVTGKRKTDSICVISSDSSGNVISVNLKKEKKISMYKAFQTPPHFIFADINNDSIPDNIFLSEHELIVFNSKKEVLMNYGFKDQISQNPTVIKINSDSYISVVSNQTNELFLINNSGFLMKGFPCYGNGRFKIANLNNDDQQMLITPNGNKITTYLLPKLLE